MGERCWVAMSDHPRSTKRRERPDIEQLLAAQRRAREEAGESQREAPTYAELAALASLLPPDEASDLLARARPVPEPSRASQAPPPPQYESYEDFLARVDWDDLVTWCKSKANKANQPRLMSGRPKEAITWLEVLQVLTEARGRCAHCGSLAVEHRPSKPGGAPASWEAVGRRIGSLGHLVSRFAGGANNKSNLVWSCLWCNTWTSQLLGPEGPSLPGSILPARASLPVTVAPGLLGLLSARRSAVRTQSHGLHDLLVVGGSVWRAAA